MTAFARPPLGWFGTLFARRAMPGAALAGVLAGLGQAPVSLPWATLAGLAIAYALIGRTRTARGAGWIGWAFGAGYFAATLYWIVEPFFVDAARHGWMAPFALFGIAAGLALFWGLAFGLARRLADGGWRLALAWPACLAGAELARSYVLTGFPWALIGHVWIGWAPMQLAAWVGPVGLSLLTLLAVSLTFAAWRRRRALAALPLAAGAALYAAGLWQAAQPVPQDPGAPVIRLVQPNAAQHLKWDPDHAQRFYDRQLAYTAAPAERRPDLIVWPETAIPTVLHRAGAALDGVAGAAAGVPVVLGIQRFDEGRAYNSLILLDGAGEVAAVYDKHHLVPFGEYVPAFELFRRLPFGALVEEHGFGYTPGPGARLVDLGALGRALPLICYEAIFPQDIRAAPARPGWLLQITNDAWFGQVAGPYQHLAQARLRAVEQGLAMVRAANTGVSAVIDARGRITASLGLGAAGFVDAALPGALPPTLYAQTGDWPAGLALAGLVLAVFPGRRRIPVDDGRPPA